MSKIEAKDTSYAGLDYRRSVEEEELGFGDINDNTRGYREKVQNVFEGSGFLNKWKAKEHIIINKLLVGCGVGSVKGDTTHFPREDSMMNKFAETFRHENENEGGERVALSNTSGRHKRS